jgi:hypothetical protein
MNWRKILANTLGINKDKYGGPFPRVRINETIEDLRVDEAGYVLGWAVVADKDRNLWIEPGTEIEGRADGTVDLFIVRRVDGLHVSPPDKFTWSPSQHAGPGNTCCIPVVNDNR